MHRSAWKKARKRIGLEFVRIHDLKHTFERRLRAAGVSFEDRQDLLGHRSGRITTHYSGAELQNLYGAAYKVCEAKRSRVLLTAVSNNWIDSKRKANDKILEHKVNKESIAKTAWCEAPHFQYQLSGKLHVKMEDGSEFETEKGEVSWLPSGHDAWVVGNEPVVLVDWSGSSHYAE